MGQLANDVRQSLEGFIAQKQAQLKSALMEQQLQKETLDVTMPGKQHAMGVRHPLNIFLDELKEIFRGMGYTVVAVSYTHLLKLFRAVTVGIAPHPHHQ